MHTPHVLQSHRPSHLTGYGDLLIDLIVALCLVPVARFSTSPPILGFPVLVVVTWALLVVALLTVPGQRFAESCFFGAVAGAAGTVAGYFLLGFTLPEIWRLGELQEWALAGWSFLSAAGGALLGIMTWLFRWLWSLVGRKAPFQSIGAIGATMRRLAHACWIVLNAFLVMAGIDHPAIWTLLVAAWLIVVGMAWSSSAVPRQTAALGNLSRRSYRWLIVSGGLLLYSVALVAWLSWLAKPSAMEEAYRQVRLGMSIKEADTLLREPLSIPSARRAPEPPEDCAYVMIDRQAGPGIAPSGRSDLTANHGGDSVRLNAENARVVEKVLMIWTLDPRLKARRWLGWVRGCLGL